MLHASLHVYLCANEGSRPTHDIQHDNWWEVEMYVSQCGGSRYDIVDDKTSHETDHCCVNPEVLGQPGIQYFH